MANFMTPQENNGRQLQSHDIFSAMRAEMERMFDRFTSGWPNTSISFGNVSAVTPSIDLKDTGKSVVIEAELPGVDEKDVSVTVQDRVLIIKGEKRQSKEEKGENQYVMERSYGSFMRSIPLPESVDEDKIVARFEKGVLTISAEKRADVARPEKRIEIKKA
jgi:HSP20 family protein